MILKISSPELPWLRFEWHPEERRAYAIRVPGNESSVLLDNIQSEREMHLAVLAFIVGYRERERETRHYRMLAEGLRLGARVGT